MATTKGIRFSEEENKAIQKFLELNPYFDFSTVARMAIMKFIEDPKIELKPSSVNDINNQQDIINNGKH